MSTAHTCNADSRPAQPISSAKAAAFMAIPRQTADVATTRIGTRRDTTQTDTPTPEVWRIRDPRVSHLSNHQPRPRRTCRCTSTRCHRNPAFHPLRQLLPRRTESITSSAPIYNSNPQSKSTPARNLPAIQSHRLCD
jgi:hypothetical protein